MRNYIRKIIEKHSRNNRKLNVDKIISNPVKQKNIRVEICI